MCNLNFSTDVAKIFTDFSINFLRKISESSQKGIPGFEKYNKKSEVARTTERPKRLPASRSNSNLEQNSPRTQQQPLQKSQSNLENYDDMGSELQQGLPPPAAMSARVPPPPPGEFYSVVDCRNVKISP